MTNVGDTQQISMPWPCFYCSLFLLLLLLFAFIFPASFSTHISVLRSYFLHLCAWADGLGTLLKCTVFRGDICFYQWNVEKVWLLISFYRTQKFRCEKTTKVSSIVWVFYFLFKFASKMCVCVYYILKLTYHCKVQVTMSLKRIVIQDILYIIDIILSTLYSLIHLNVHNSTRWVLG